MNTILSVVLGIGLAAACGFRVFVPFLVVGIAATVQALTVGARKISLVTTGGIGNPVVATGELLGSIVLSVVAVALPLLALAVVAWGLFFGVRFVLRRAPGSGVSPGGLYK